jgi:hypothetical protein
VASFGVERSVRSITAATWSSSIIRALGIGVEFIEDAPSFDAVVDVIAQGRADIGISKLSQTYYRLMRVRFSEPYITLRHALLFDRAAIATVSGNRPPEESLRLFRARLEQFAVVPMSISAGETFPMLKWLKWPVGTRPSRN